MGRLKRMRLVGTQFRKFRLAKLMAEFPDVHRPAEEPPLGKLHSAFSQEAALRLGFHSFGYDVEAQRVSHLDDESDHLTGGAIGPDRLHKRLINLQRVEIELLNA